MNLEYYEWLVKNGQARVVSVQNVWSNGKSIRRYQGQGEESNRSPANGYRQMTAILIEKETK